MPLTTSALKTARRLRSLLIQQKIPVVAVYLFGSAARGTASRWSDIDIAVVCNPFEKTPLQEYTAIARSAFSIDSSISVLYFRPEHFKNPYSGVVQEIKREGIAVA